MSTVPPGRIRVMIADDQRVVRDGLSMLVSLIDDVEIVGRACRLLRLVSGTQAQAREESWKKRHVEFPRFTADEERARHSG